MSPRTTQTSPVAELQDAINHCSTRYGVARKRLTGAVKMAGIGPNYQEQIFLQVREIDSIILACQAALRLYLIKTGEEP